MTAELNFFHLWQGLPIIDYNMANISKMPEKMSIYERSPKYSYFISILTIVKNSILKYDYIYAREYFSKALKFAHRFGQRDTCLTIMMYRQALVVWPQNPDAWINFGVLKKQNLKFSHALKSFRRAQLSNPSLQLSYFHFASLLELENCKGDRTRSAERAVLLSPDHRIAWSVLANHLARLSYSENLGRYYRRPAMIEPSSPGNWTRLGAFYSDFGRGTSSRRALQRGLVLAPSSVELCLRQSLLSMYLGETGSARLASKKALYVQPGQARLWTVLANIYSASQMHSEAILSLNRALVLEPQSHNAASSKLVISESLPGLTFKEHCAMRAEFASRWGRNLAGRIKHHTNVPHREKTLKIGYVSADFKEQSAAFCFGPAVKNHDKRFFEIYLYSGVVSEDLYTLEFRNAADHWIDARSLSDKELVSRIIDDQIDVLVDLSGFLTGNRLTVFAAKPAPIQITGWGFASGTGMLSIDYLFSDPVAIPAADRKYLTEEVIDLPCQIALEGPRGAPKIVDLPFDANGIITFGCMNRTSKITDEMLDCCARIMRRVPTSRLIFKDISFSDNSIRKRLEKRFGRNGIEQDRLEFFGATSRNVHLETYNTIDIALDTFPFGGGVTTLEALWMGVPVVCILGSSQPSRVAASIVSAIGKPEWAAPSINEYEDLAVSFANDKQQLRKVRANLRNAVRTSRAGSPEQYAHAVETAYRRVWRKWCNKQSC